MNNQIKSIKGPILVFGAGGFIGFNLFTTFLKERKDVYGVFRNPQKNWRLNASKISKKNIIKGDITNEKQLKAIFKKIRPNTIYNMAAYGAYSSQEDLDQIYETNFISSIKILEILKERKFAAYIYAGSQSEYGLNSKSPKEQAELIPNSHYAVSKVGSYYALKYYGKKLSLPVLHLRIYSAYGPWEERDRLIPTLLFNAAHGKYPNLVDPDISRDFIYIDDVVNAFIVSAIKINKKNYGDVFNIATNKKTTIKQIVFLVKDIFNITEEPVFGKMKNRSWDVRDWYGNSGNIRKSFGWKPKVSLKEGIVKTTEWQKNYEIKNGNYVGLKI